MAILFDNIPGNLRVPLFYAEFAPGGTPYENIQRLLLIGQMTTGQATPGQAILVGEGLEDGLFGPGSMITQMIRAARSNAPFQEIWALPLADLVAGVKATGKVTVANVTPASAGQATIYIAGRRIRVPILTSDTRAQIASALVAAINGEVRLPLTAAVNGVNNFEVDLTAKHKGSLGNFIDLDLGLVGDEGLLGKQLFTITAMSGGSGDPDLQTPFANLADEPFEWIAAPYADATNISRAIDLLNDVSGRWGPYKQIYGHYITTKVADFADLATLGDGLNNQHISIMGAWKSPTPPWVWTAAVGAKAAHHLQDAPELSRPLQSLELREVLPPRIVADRFTVSERNSLYYDGISGYTVGRDGVVRIDRVVTTYKANAYGSPDWTYLDIETMAQSVYGIRFLRQKIENQHGRKALANSNPAGLPHIVTVADIRNTLIHGYQELVALGVFEGADVFARDIVVERDENDANRVNANLPLDHVNQLRVLAARAVNYMERRSPAEALAAA
ncbi:MAG: phage tail sheath subtilisin-like domain-containing protein [Hyphomicrobiales bacterium]|nr:phage tail sheath subtilisin-like domain-containing protein [Hyphomicrobiales bacterium]